jgi:peptide/nickel transport system substrate-binding protein
MLTRKLWSLLSVLMVLALLVAACAPAATPAPTQAPAPTAAPKPTDVPATEAPKATDVPPTAAPMAELAKKEAPKCDAGEMKTIEAVDEKTVKFTLCTPDPAFPAKIAFSSFAIQSAKQLEETGGKPLDKPLGTGPYMLTDWTRGDSLTLIPNPNYNGPNKPKAQTVVFKWNSEAAARLNALKAGEVDGIDNPDPNDFKSIQEDKTLQLIPREATNVFYLGMNNTKAPFDNEKVRQAIAMGIDRQTIVDKYYPPGSSVADFFTPCSIPGGCEGEAWYKYDPDAAKALLKEAGFEKGFKVKLAYRDVVRGYLPSPGKVAEELQAQLKKLGIEVTIDVQESATFLDNASAGNLELFLLGWGADYPDQTNFLDYHFGKGANDSFGKKFDDITSTLAKAASLSDQTERNKLYAEANKLIKQHVPMIPVAHGGSGVAYKATVEGAHSSPLGNENMAVMAVPGQDTFVWMQNGEPPSLYCADETDGEALRACEQIFESLLSYKIGGTEVEPGLAAMPTANADLTEWTLVLRDGAKFSDGTPVTANDVVKTLAVQWDAADPLHTGRSGAFDYWSGLFGGFMNPPATK